MAQVIRMMDFRARQSPVHFDRAELATLLELYSRRVAAGEWRDYAIDHGPQRAVFSVFRHARESALVTVTKLGSGWMVAGPGGRTTRAASLADVIATLERPQT
ncbi:DUF2794 domain-containing protein [Magnetospirillum sp. UT-4]|uniref:DUF2794 domain-containing protein n=1 Tax=Magnetospirillum sp. UT-4 TaxID=2681467 RepID=UPI00137CE85F|nr:DUF2794 domain-containing protein [Magnetospirillum sp. UT-4]CAA7619804.1 conserved hypothetical protein [Magnetospirillum sp. UT-4]